MALMLGHRVDDERIDGALLAPIGIVILARHRGSEPDDALPISRDEYPEGRLGWAFDGSPPRIDHIGQRHGGKHQLRQLGWPLHSPGASLQLSDGRGLLGPGETYGSGNRLASCCTHGRDSTGLDCSTRCARSLTRGGLRSGL